MSCSNSVSVQTKINWMDYRCSFRSRDIDGIVSVLHRLQTGSGAHPASYPVGTGGSFSEGVSGRGVNPTTHLHLLLRLRMRRAIYPIPQYVFMGWCLVKHSNNFKL